MVSLGLLLAGWSFSGAVTTLLHVAVVSLSLADPGALCYTAEETDCYGHVDRDILSTSYWVPPGVPQRALRTLPWRQLTIRPSSIPGAGLGVFSNTFIKKHTLLGHYEGELVSAQSWHPIEDYEYTWQVSKNDDLSHYIDGAEESLSNWLRYVNCPRHVVEESLVYTLCYGRIHYLTKIDIAPGQELLIYYGDGYAETLLNMDVDNFFDPTYADSLTGKSNKSRIL